MNTNFYSQLKRPLLLCVFMLSTLLAFAQDRRVTGKVAGSDGQGIPGVSVLVKGTQTGTSTDANGAFAISLKAGKDVLSFSGIGYRSTDVKVGTQTTVNVTMNEDVSALDEVIVTGYATSGKKESTAAVATVKAKDLKQVPSGNIEQQLQGRVSGVTVITNGQPGTNSIIRVRGFGSIGGEGANNPLYIVDGLPVGSTDFLSPDDIETTTVLKDAAAASIYGARAAAGVIVYTTKKGKKGARRMEITYDGNYGVTDPNVAGAPKMLSPQEQADWTHIAYRNNAAAATRSSGATVLPQYTHPQYGTDAQATLPAYLHANGVNGVRGSVDLAAVKLAAEKDPFGVFLIRPNLAGTNWYDEVTNAASIMRHNLGFSGGTENGRYYFGLSAQDQKGILLNNDFKRYSFRANSEFDLGKRVRIGENLQFTYRSVRGQGGANNGLGVALDESPILAAYRMPTVIPVFDDLGNYASTKASGFNNPRNPVRSRQLNGANDGNFSGSAFGNLYLEVDPIPNLTLRSSIGGQFFSYAYKDYNYKYLGDSEPEASDSFSEGSGYGLSWTFTNTAAYKAKFGQHSVSVLVGLESLNDGAGRQINGSGINPFSTDLDYVNLSTVQNRQVNSFLYNGNNFYSLFSEVKYNWKEKYYLGGVVRRDGSSKFGANNRYGVFPAFSGAWRVSSEDFMKEIPAISDLKLRVGWGEMGNSNPVNPNNQYSLFGSNLGSSFYPITGANSGADEGYYRTRIGNPDAKWETSISTNIGVDLSLLSNKYEISIDFWRKDTKDLLFGVPLPAVIGTGASAPAVNIASMRNEGIDIQLIKHGVIGKDAKFDLTFTGSFLNNKITSLAPNINFFGGGGQRGIGPIRNQVGYGISSFYGYKQIGYFSSVEDVKSSPAQTGADVGRFKYADTDGKPGITPDDRTIIGSPIPTFTGGITFDLKYKSWDFTTNLFTSLGNDIFNLSKWYTDFHGTFEGSGKGVRAKDSWTPALGNSAKAPIWESASNISTSGAENSWYIENGSYLRMQNFTIGYTLPANVTSKLGIKKARISGSANNIFTVTSYSGLDPAVGGAVDTTFGIDVGNYPTTRSFNVGLNLAF